MNTATVHRRPGTFSDRFCGPKPALRRIRRAAGPAGCEGGDRPGELIVFASKVEAVLAALAAAGITVVNATEPTPRRSRLRGDGSP